MNSEGTQFLFDNPEFWASYEDLQAAKCDARIYGVSFSTMGDDGLLKRIDPSKVDSIRGGGKSPPENLTSGVHISSTDNQASHPRAAPPRHDELEGK